MNLSKIKENRKDSKEFIRKEFRKLMFDINKCKMVFLVKFLFILTFSRPGERIGPNYFFPETHFTRERRKNRKAITKILLALFL